MKLSPFIPFLIPSSAAAFLPRRVTQHSHDLSHAPIPSIPGPTFRLAGSRIALSSSSSSSITTIPESTKAGARLSGTNITSVSATFRVPAADMPATGPTAGNENGVYQASYWVGIDGLTASSCGGGNGVRAGVDTFWDAGTRTAGAWFEWYPDVGPEQFGNFTVRQGDAVRITATADADGLGGEVTVERVDGVGCEAAVLASASKRFDAVREGDRLCLGEAAVVIEDYPILSRPDVPLPFANFTEVVFEQVKVGGVKAKGLEVFDIRLEAQGGRLTDCEGEEGRVDCRRVVGDAWGVKEGLWEGEASM